MGDVLPISALLTATPIADPTGAPVAVPAGAPADPFAELLAVVVGAQGAAALAPVPAPAPATGTTETAVADGDLAVAVTSPTADDDGPVADAPKTDDGKLDDTLAATLTAMLAIAPPPAPVAVPVRAARAETPAVIPTVTSAPPAAEAPALDAAPAKPDIGGESPKQSADKAAHRNNEAKGKQAAPDGSAASTDGADTPKPGATPAVPAAILRMLREAQATTALSRAPAPPAPAAAPLDPMAATGAPEAAQPAAAAPPPTRDAAPATRRDDRPVAPRAASASAGRAAQPRTARLSEVARRLPTEAVAVPFADLRQPAVAATELPSAPAAGQVDSLVQNQLTIAQDGKWLDSLARDIAASTNGSDLHFKLNPENLGSLTVSIAALADGTAVRMTADTERARTILTDAQPRLIAEARAQGLRISESHVDLNNNSSNANGGSTPWGQAGGQPQPQGERRSQTSSPNHLPLAPTRSDEAVETPEAGTSERYA